MFLTLSTAICSMTTLEHSRHAIRRKGYAPHYTLTNLSRFQPEFHEATYELVNVTCFDRY